MSVRKATLTRLTSILLSLGFTISIAAETADLRATISAPSRVSSGQEFTWTATVENLGPDTATNVNISVYGGGVSCDGERFVTLPAGEKRTYSCTCRGFETSPPYAVQLDASIYSPDTPDPTLSNNAARAFVAIDTPPDLVVLINNPFRVDRLLPFTFDVHYRNAALTAATGVTITVGSSERIVAVPENCTIDGRTAICSIGTIGPNPNPAELSSERLRFTTVAPDADAARVEFTASIRGNEADHVASNDRTGSFTRTFDRTILVTNTNDSGSGSLRAAIDEANASCPGHLGDALCKIAFRIEEGPSPSSRLGMTGGWHTIQPQAPLPALVKDNVSIDGTTQSRLADTNPLGPEIEINGTALTEGNGITMLSRCGGIINGLAINGFPDNGIFLGGPQCDERNGNGGRIVGLNYIGTDPTGTKAVPNLRGIFVAPEGLDFFAPALIRENVISGNRYSGIWIANGSQTRIIKNAIGLNAAITAPLGNGSSGVYIEASGSGTDLLDNFIGFNGHAGLSLARGTVQVQSNGNSFQGNGSLAIDHGLDGASPSVPDPGERPGNTLFAPVIVSATYDASANTTVIRGTVQTQPSQGFRSIFISLYANDAPDESGFGEGQYLIGRADPDKEGNFVFTHRGPTPGPWIAATATSYQVWGFARGPETDANGGGYATNTSELSRTVEVSR